MWKTQLLKIVCKSVEKLRISGNGYPQTLEISRQYLRIVRTVTFQKKAVGCPCIIVHVLKNIIKEPWYIRNLICICICILYFIFSSLVHS